MQSRRKIGTIKPYPNPFEPLTPALAWVLGLWFADGCVCSTGYEALLFQKDPEVLLKVKKLIAPLDDPDRVKINRSRRSKGTYGSGYDYRLSVSSVQFVGYLEALGVHPRKARAMLWPTWLVDELLAPFVRGLYDGDGTIYIAPHGDSRTGGYLRATYYSGTRQFIQALRDAIVPVVQRRLKVGSDRTTYQLQAAAGTARKLCAWMYEGSTEETRLKRKHEVYTQQLRRRQKCCLE